MKSWWSQYLTLPWERKLLCTALAVALIPVAVVGLWPSPQSEAKSPSARGSAGVDTYIPKGFVLIPIEVKNHEALDSLVGRFALVDLFQGSEDENAPLKPVARNVRLLRAPQNPSHFAILVPDSETDHVMRTGGAFTVTVKRQNGDGIEFVKSVKRISRKIVYDGGS